MANRCFHWFIISTQGSQADTGFEVIYAITHIHKHAQKPHMLYRRVHIYAWTTHRRHIHINLYTHSSQTWLVSGNFMLISKDSLES